MIMWDKVPRGTLVKCRISEHKYTICFYKKMIKDNPILIVSKDTLFEDYQEYYTKDVELLLPEDIAKYTDKKATKYYCHCGKELDDLIYTTCMDAAMSFVVCVNCGCVYSKIKSNNIGIPKEVDND